MLTSIGGQTNPAICSNVNYVVDIAKAVILFQLAATTNGCRYCKNTNPMPNDHHNFPW